MINKSILKIIVAVFLTVVLISCGKDQKSSGDKSKDSKTEDKSSNDSFSPDKAFHVKFEISGNMTGTIDAYYYQKQARIENHMNMNGMQVVSTAYTNNDVIYTVSEVGGKKMGFKMDAKKYAEESGKKEGQFDMTSFKDKLKTDYNKTGTEEILGKTCDIYESKDGKYKLSIYKETVPLKFDFGKMKFVATAFEQDVKVTDDMFTPPKDVNYSEMNDMIKGLNNTNDKMKDLDSKKKEIDDVMKKYNK